MNDEIREELEELSAVLYMIKVAMRYVDDKDIVDRAMFSVIRHIDRLTE